MFMLAAICLVLIVCGRIALRSPRDRAWR